MNESSDIPPRSNVPGWVSTLGAVSWLMVIAGAVLWFLRNDVAASGIALLRVALSVLGFIGIIVVPIIRKRYE